MADLTQAIRLNHRHLRALYSRGLVNQARHDYDHAIADYSEAIHVDHNYAYAYGNRARARRARGDLDHAIADFNEFAAA